MMTKERTQALTWSILDNVQDGVIVTRNDGSLVYANSRAWELIGQKQAAIETLSLAQIIPDTDSRQKLLNPPAQLDLYIAGALTKVNTYRWQEKNHEFIQVFFYAHEPAVDTSSDNVVRQLAALTRISSEPDFDKKLQLIVDGLQMTGWHRVVLTLRDAAFYPSQIITAGFSEAERTYLKEHLLPVASWTALFQSDEGLQFRRGSCYFVPGTSAWSHEYFPEMLAAVTPDAGNHDTEAWHPRDVLAVPLFDQQQQKIGLITLDQPLNNLRPTEAVLQTIELYAQHAASVIENTKLIEEALARSHELQILAEASSELASTLEKDMVLSLAGKHLLRAINADGYTIYQWQEDNECLVVLQNYTAVNGGKAAAIGSTLPATTDRQPIQQVIQTQQPQILSVVDDLQIPTDRPDWLPPEEAYTSILLPIILSETTFGVVELIKRGTQPLDDRALSLLSTLASQASGALETAFVFEETFERERFYNALGTVNLAINFTLELDTVLNLICSESLRIFNVDGAYIWLREENQFIGSTAKGHAENEFTGKVVNTNEDDVFVNQVANNRQALFINNISEAQNVRFKLPQRETIQAALGVPLEQEGNIVGVLILIDKSMPHRFTEKDVAQATTFGVQTTIALQNAKLFAELRDLNEELDLRVAKRTQALHEESNRVKILLRITSELSASLDQDRVLNQALHLVNEVVNATQGVIMLIDQRTGELVFRAAFGVDRRPGPRGLPSGLMRDEGLAGWMIENRSSVIVHDTRQDPRWVERETSREHRSVLAVPLMTGEEVIGVLMLFHARPNAFTMQQLDLVEAAAIQVANAINNANLYLLIRDQAERLGQTLHLEQIDTAKNQAILESIADGVIVADAENQITLANLPAGSILGITRGDLIGKSINEFLGLYGQSQHSWLSTIKEWAKDADRLEQWTYIDEQLPIEDKVVSVHLSPVLAGKQFFGTVSIFRDITKEVELDRLKSEFVSTVSHELRTPMTSIKGYVDLMLMGAAGQMSNPQTRYLQVIKNNAERLHMLVNDLLDISRIETGKTTLDLRPVDIAQLVEQVVETHLRGRIQHENKLISVITDTPPNLPLVNIDHARITQVLTNLLDNAFNYTSADGEIRVIARENGNYVYISVNDTGIGISKEDQTKIFDRFYRAEDEIVQKVSGTGLGLAIVRSLVEMHNGQLTVESSPGVGSTFTFNLPVVVEDSEAA